MIIGCADSRVDPATIFAAGPGELFVARNVAALVPPYDESGGYHGTSASVEFAVQHLGITDILVMGHSFCGGIKAALATDAPPTGRFLGPWVGLLSEKRDAMLADPDGPKDPAGIQNAMESLAVSLSIENLQTFPFVREAMAAGRLRLHGARFSIAEGELQWLDPKTGAFAAVIVSDAASAPAAQPAG